MDAISKKLAASFAESYDIGDAARKCGMKICEAKAKLAESAFRRAVDDAVFNRIYGSKADITRRAIEEFERIAFSDDETFKPAEKIKAIEQLFRLTPQCEDASVTICYDYRGSDNG